MSVALLVVLGTAHQAMAQDATTPYPKTAPIEQYLMDRTAEIALARSAAPESISRDATILILGRQGYETAVQGNNGFVCMVGRGWGAAFALALDSTKALPSDIVVNTFKAAGPLQNPR